MKCPHCDVAVRMEFEEASPTYQFDEEDKKGSGYELMWDHCPECDGFVVVLKSGPYVAGSRGREHADYDRLAEIKSEEMLYPKSISRPVAPEVPERYGKDLGLPRFHGLFAFKPQRLLSF